MNKTRSATALALALALSGGAAGALGIQHLFKVPALTYSPDAVVQGTSTVRVSNEGYSGPVAVAFTQLSLTPAPAPPAEGLGYGLYQSSSAPTKPLALNGSPTSADQVLLGSFPPSAAGAKTRLDLSFAVLVSPLLLPPPGTYTATIRADLYASSFPLAGAPVDSFTFAVAVTVGSHFDVSLAATGSGSGFSLAATSGSMAFGVLAEGDSKALDLYVRSNVAYSLSATSAGAGKLVNAADGSGVPYSLSSNGTAVDLGLAGSLAAGAPATYSLPARYALGVTILPFPALPTEGDYADSLTLTVTAP